MTRELFIQNKSLSIEIKRLVYDDLRYKKTRFVHRKTLMNNLFIFNNTYFYILWRFFYIQNDVNDVTTDEEIQLLKNNSFRIYNQFIQNFLNVNHIKKFMSKKALKQFNNPNSEKLTNMLLNSKQNITELFYLCPLNLKSEQTYDSIQKLFLDKTNILEELFDTNSNNLNFYDIGVVSKIIDKDESNGDELFNFINSNCINSILISDGLYKSVIWNLINNGIKQNKNFVMKTI